MHTRTGPLASVPIIFAALTIADAPSVHAQESDNIRLEEIVVVGTRRQGRTITDSPVPVDVFQGRELIEMGTGDMDEVLRTLIPSFNVLIHSLDDESSLNRPATLRGLPPDNTLVLLNGKRLHRSGIIGFHSGGQQGTDLSIIPATAVKQLEVLRDGASAQYGSDAIAGVLNFVTRDSSDGVFLQYEVGEYFEGDGQSKQFSMNIGLPLTENGFLNLSAEYSDRETTTRAIQAPDAALLESFGVTGIPSPVQEWGQPRVSDDIKIFANSAIALSESSDIYGFVNYARRNSEINFFWRNPNRQGGIFVDDGDHLVFDLTSDGSGNCPTAGTASGIPAPHPFFATQAEYDADQIVLSALAADPNCWVINELHPSGYRPIFGAEIEDLTAVAGYRGEGASGFRYDISASYGKNAADYKIRNTINASLGPDSPSVFNPGETIQIESAINVDFVWPLDLNAFNSPLNVATGFEWRDESYETVAGDEPSYFAGPLHLQGANIGAHGYAGYAPDHANEWSRSNIALYIDLETDITENFLLGLAGRYEDFEDFGSTSNYKVSFRYAIGDAFAVRGSASTGFHAPAPGQSNATRLSTRTGGPSGLVQIGLIPPTNPVAQFYGGVPLRPEESDNLSIGFSLQLSNNLIITLDAFRIDVEDQIEIGPRIELTPEDIDELIDLGVPNASDFSEIEFFANLEKARVTGIDLVANYVFDWQSAGATDLTLAWNNTKFEITSDELPDRRTKINKEYQPRNRVITTIGHTWRDLRISARASFYDSWVEADLPFGPPTPVCSDERPVPFGADGCYDALWVLDLEAAYTFADRYTVVAGADNILDEYPDTDFLYPDFSGGRIYTSSSPIGYGGGYWYLRLRAEF